LRRHRRALVLTGLTAVAVAVGVLERPALVVGFVVCAMVFVPLEEILPLVPRAGLRRSAWVDITHTFANRIPITVGIGVGLAFLAPHARAAFPGELRAAVAAWPAWLQVLVVVLVLDLVNYLAHRALHEFPTLWRVHAVHHSSQELDWLSTSRGHPIDQIVNMGVLTLPLYALALPIEFSAAILAFTFFYLSAIK
jgi:sterol desaturase/sphingolipid hydroxylase (fatty acid hydroxylase superfamily)